MSDKNEILIKDYGIVDFIIMNHIMNNVLQKISYLINFRSIKDLKHLDVI